MKWWEVALAVFVAVIYIHYISYSAAWTVGRMLAGDLEAIKARILELDDKVEDLQQTANEIREQTESRRPSVNPFDPI